MTRILPGVLAMATIVVASNILVQFLILDGLLTWGAFTYPLAFLVTDVMNRIYGASEARKVVFAGLVTGIICSLIGSQIMLEFGPAVPIRIAIASATAFLIAQLLDIKIFNAVGTKTWWKAPLFSTLVCSVIDTVVFFSLAFAAIFNPISMAAAEQIMWAQEDNLWITLAIADWGVKVAVALIALVPFRLIVGQRAQSTT